MSREDESRPPTAVSKLRQIRSLNLCVRVCVRMCVRKHVCIYVRTFDVRIAPKSTILKSRNMLLTQTNEL